MLPEGFVYIKDVIPSVCEDIRYAGSHNFVGCWVDGYFAPRSVLKKEAAEALKKAAEAFENRGLYLLIYDAYRPQRAVDHFVRWEKDPDDVKTKDEFYPTLDKSELFPKGYIAVYSGHSRGLTVDLTLTDKSVLDLWTAKAEESLKKKMAEETLQKHQEMKDILKGDGENG